MWISRAYGILHRYYLNKLNDMNILYVGGQKSGKSNAASDKALSLSKGKPYYVATYDNSYDDPAMATRINKHIEQRREDFITIEQAFDLTAVVDCKGTYVIDCLSMWLFNNIDQSEHYLLDQLQRLMANDSDFIFVLNDVGSGVIPMDSQSRRFVDLSGIVGQFVARHCEEVYRVSVGIAQQLK